MKIINKNTGTQWTQATHKQTSSAQWWGQLRFTMIAITWTERVCQRILYFPSVFSLSLILTRLITHVPARGKPLDTLCTRDIKASTPTLTSHSPCLYPLYIFHCSFCCHFLPLLTLSFSSLCPDLFYSSIPLFRQCSAFFSLCLLMKHTPALSVSLFKSGLDGRTWTKMFVNCKQLGGKKRGQREKIFLSFFLFYQISVLLDGIYIIATDTATFWLAGGCL